MALCFFVSGYNGRFKSTSTIFFGRQRRGAAIASHLANDMTKSLGCRAHTFHDPAHITCFSNDYGYEKWLAESIKNFVDENDVVILISSSGRSENVLFAAEAALHKMQFWLP